MKLNWSHWFYTLLKTVIGGVAATGSAWLGTLVGNQVDNAIPVLQFNQLWSVLLSSTLLNLFFFLKQSPLPEDDDAKPSPPSASRLGLFLLCGFLSFCLMGCAGSYDRQVFRIEGAALGTADGAMRGYAVYYKAATNNPTAFKRSLADLNAERDRICALSVKVGASGELVEQLRQSYKTNSAVQPALAAGVATLVANMNGILTYATNVIHINPE
mgnify:CR=1 FL=1